MPKEKSSISKLLEGRCQKKKEQYSAWIHANEVGSIGSSFVIPDPIAKREVHLLSNAERIVFWQLRYDPDVTEIREQMLLFPKFVDEICTKKGFRKPNRILTTDFLVEYKVNDNTIEAISVKPAKDVYEIPALCTYRTVRQIERKKELLEVQKIYWEEYFEVPFQDVYSDELDSRYSINIERCMAFYELEDVDNEEHLLRHMIAHRYLEIDLTGEYVCFKELLKTHRYDMQQAIERLSGGLSNGELGAKKSITCTNK